MMLSPILACTYTNMDVPTHQMVLLVENTTSTHMEVHCTHFVCLCADSTHTHTHTLHIAHIHTHTSHNKHTLHIAHTHLHLSDRHSDGHTHKTTHTNTTHHALVSACAR